MTIEADLYTVLSSAPAVTALCGTRIYPNVVPEEVPLPAVAWARLYTDPYTTLDGQILAQRAGVQLTCMGNDYVQSVTLADAVRTALAGANQFVTTLEGERDTWDGDARRAARIIDVLILQ